MAIGVKVNDGDEKQLRVNAWNGLSLRPNTAVFYGEDDLNNAGDFLFKEDLFHGVKRAMEAEALKSPKRPKKSLLSCAEFLECLMIVFGFRKP